MNIQMPNVRDVNFQHKTLSHIHEKPHYKNLKTLQDKLKAITSSIPSTLGGGMYSHLGLLLTPACYATLSVVPFTTPVKLGRFVPPAGGTSPQIAAAKDMWHITHDTFKLSQAIKKALISQVAHAIDSTYLATLWNSNISQYGNSIHALLEHLFSTYGQITPNR